MRRIREYYITIIVIVMVIIVNVGAFAAYITNVNASLSGQTDAHINDMVDEVVECINLKLEEQMNALETLSVFVSSVNKYEQAEEILNDVFKEQSESIGYSMIEIVNAEGVGKTTGDNYTEKKYFKKALEGKTVMLEETEGESIVSVAFATPVYNGENIEDVLIAKMNVEVFSDTIELSSFSQNGKVFVIKKDGALVSKSKGLSEAQTINDIFPEKKYEEKLISSMRSRTSDIITYESENTKRYIGHSKLAYNSWYVVCIISSNAVEANVGDMETDVIILGVEIAFILLVLVVYLIYNIVSVKNKENMNLERYYIASKYADTIMLDYSIAKNTMYCNDKWNEKFGYMPPKANVREAIKQYISEEDIEKYEEKIDLLIKDNKKSTFSIHILDKDNNAKACKIKLFPICAKKGRVTKIIGLIESEE